MRRRAASQRRRMLEIQYHRLLAGIHGDERRRHAVVAAVGAVVAHGVADARRLDLDDLGAEQAQQVRRVRSRHHMAEIDDPDPVQGAAHAAALHCIRSCRRARVRHHGARIAESRQSVDVEAAAARRALRSAIAS